MLKVSFLRTAVAVFAVALISRAADAGASGRVPVLLELFNRQESHVARGENGGRTLTHVAVTRVLKQVGQVDFDVASAKEVVVPVQPGSGNGLRVVAFIQDPKSGRVLGVVEQKL
jgi:hypothetical protein